MKVILKWLLPLLVLINISYSLRTYTKADLIKLRFVAPYLLTNMLNVYSFREEVREMFYHAYDSYLKYAYPYDELRPISCDGIDTYGR